MEEQPIADADVRLVSVPDAHACPNVRYYVDAYDYYHNHVYMYTRYCFMQI